MQHSKFSPSSSSRWLNCPPAADGSDDETSYAADLGTLIHEMISGEGQEIPDWVEEADRALIPEIIATYIERLPYGVELETRLQSKIIDDFGGTIDALHVTEDTLNVLDLKTGRGAVQAEDNTQLLCYLILADEFYPGRTKFTATIIQPRLNYVGTATYTREDIEAFRERVKIAAKGTKRAAGSHCKYCPLLAACDTVVEYAADLLDVKKPTIRQWAAIVSFGTTFENLVKRGKEELLKELSAGRKVPDFKLTERSGKKMWVDEKEVSKYYKDEPNAFVRSVVSVYDAEKLGLTVPEDLVTRGKATLTVSSKDEISREVLTGQEFGEPVVK